MQPSAWKKRSSWMERKLEFNAAKALATGDSIASIDSIVMLDASGVDVSASMIIPPYYSAGAKIYVEVSGGTAGQTYTLRIRLNTTNGDKVEDSLIIKVVA